MPQADSNLQGEHSGGRDLKTYAGIAILTKLPVDRDDRGRGKGRATGGDIVFRFAKFCAPHVSCASYAGDSTASFASVLSVVGSERARNKHRL